MTAEQKIKALREALFPEARKNEGRRAYLHARSLGEDARRAKAGCPMQYVYLLQSVYLPQSNSRLQGMRKVTSSCGGMFSPPIPFGQPPTC